MRLVYPLMALLHWCVTCAGDTAHRNTEKSNNTNDNPYSTACRTVGEPYFSHESRLINCLLERYSRVTTLARPVEDSTHNVVIDFGLTLIQILDFDEIKQVLTTSLWKNYGWHDQVLRWKPSEFGGVTHIRLPATKIWTPDIVLYNKCDRLGCSSSSGSDDKHGRLPATDFSHSGYATGADADEQAKQHDELAAVFYNGTIKWIPPAIYRSSCEINMQNFPFDEQNCYFKFASWTYDQHKVDIALYQNLHEIDLREYIGSSEWEVINTSATRYVRRYPFFETDPYPELIFELTLKRQSTFYIYLLVLPCLLLSSLTLVLFWIPPQRPDRTAVGMSLFSSFFILLLILVQSSPPTSASISRLGINYCVNMVLIAVSTMLSVVIINIGHPSTTSRGPKWFTKSQLEVVCRFLCIRASSLADIIEESAEHGLYHMECLNGNNSRSHNDIASRYKHVGEAVVTWHTFAAILDRIFFYVYLVVIILSTVFIFPR